MKLRLILLTLLASFFLILTGCDRKPETGSRTRVNSTEKTKATYEKKKVKYKKVAIATAGVTGVYYPVGRLISRIVNAKSNEYKIEIQPKVSKGSLHNINAVLKGDADLAIAQSDLQYQAARGEKEWRENGPQKNLRSICSLYPEAITLVALKTSGIKRVKDTRGKRVNLGNYGSGNLENSVSLINSLGMSVKDIKPQYFHPALASRKLAQGAIDAFFYTVGHPNAEIKEVSYVKKIMIVPIQGPEIEALINKHSYYVRSSIDKKYYPYITNREKTIPSFAVKATLITSAATSAAIVYAVAKEIFENINELKNFHPALSSLKKENMFTGLSAPLHPGAMAYYKEKGLAKYISPSLYK